jgi:ribonuclease-3
VLRRYYNYYWSKDKNFTRQLTKILGFMPRYLHFYKRAFTHKSISNTKKGEGPEDPYNTFNNERLEYLGDAILDAVMAEYLFKKYPVHDEGFLTQMRSKMVNRKTLNKISADMGLEVFLRQHGTSRVSQTMMGNTFEAFIGAIYLDVGYLRTRKFIIHRILKQYLDVHFLESLNDNFKSILLEYCQKNQKNISYEVLEHFRTKNNREKFKVAVLIDEIQEAVAEDFNKKSAEQNASRLALIKLGILDSTVEPISENSTGL